MSMRASPQQRIMVFSFTHRDHRRGFQPIGYLHPVFGKTSAGGLDIDADGELRTLVFAVAAPVNPSGLAALDYLKRAGGAGGPPDHRPAAR
jgi:hypothetical protein